MASEVLRARYGRQLWDVENNQAQQLYNGISRGKDESFKFGNSVSPEVAKVRRELPFPPE